MELSRETVQYLEKLFNFYKNRDSQKLEEAGIERIFATMEEGVPWKVRLETQYQGGITFEGWIGLWQKYFSHKTHEAFESLLYIGYCGKLKDTITLHRFKPTESLKVSKRKVFNIYLVGQHNTDVILDAFIRNQEGSMEV